MEHYWRSGPGSVSISELCRQVGLSKPALYREFGGEEGLLLASLDRYRETVLVPRQAALTADVPFVELFERAVEALTMDLETPPGCLLTRLRAERFRLTDAVEVRIRELEEEQLSAFQTWYRAGLERGDVNPDLPPELAARYLDLQFATVLTQRILGEPPERIRALARLAARAFAVA